MRRLLIILFLFLQAGAWAQGLKDIIKAPPTTKLVHDYAAVLSDFQKQHLEDKLKLYDDSTSNNVAIVLVKTLDGYSLEDAATELFRNWGIGQKDKNNGVLILAAIDDRKIKIEVGDGLEKAIPDYTASQIIDNDIKPNFKAQKYYEGLEAATNNLILAAEGQYKAPAGYGKKSGKSGNGFIRLMVTMFVVVIALAFIGGRKGGGNGGMLSRRGYSNWGGGTVISNWGGGGSSSGGGGWSGGGFGGFGGGSSSGGGASGDW